MVLWTVINPRVFPPPFGLAVLTAGKTITYDLRSIYH
jgi:hypothetical protein